MSTDTAQLIDTTVTAEEAPLGVQLWPTYAPAYAPNFTLERVEIVRTTNGTHVQWVYESGATRQFRKGEQIAVRVTPEVHAQLPRPLLGPAIPAQAATGAHWADGEATRPTRTVTPRQLPPLTDNQASLLMWYATGNMDHVRGRRINAATRRRLEIDFKLIERIDAHPYYQATIDGRRWLTENGYGELIMRLPYRPVVKTAADV